jgi:GGDEF domain-containing protein
MFVYDTSHAARICTVCGMSIYFQEHTSKDVYKEENAQILSKVAYKRVNHFREWLNSIQGRQQGSEQLRLVIQRVQNEIRKERITEMDRVTPDRIRAYLHNLKLGKYYEHTSAIYARITSKPIPNFTASTESTLMHMFVAIQPVFDEMEICEKKRKNFLSYSYTLNKLSQIIGRDDILEFVPLLKSREKLHLQDKLWKHICIQLNWPFHPSI